MVRIGNSGKEMLLHKTVAQDGRKVKKKKEERRPAEAHTEILMGPRTISSGIMVEDLRNVYQIVLYTLNTAI